jgi:hypothetical protein
VSGSTTVLPPESRRLAGFPQLAKGFDKFCKFCEQRLNNKQFNIK